MTPMLLVIIAAFIGVSALVGGVALLVRGERDLTVENRLDVLTHASAANLKDVEKSTLITNDRVGAGGVIDRILQRFGDVSKLLDQADSKLSIQHLVLASGGLALAGAIGVSVAKLHPGFIPVAAITGGLLPFCYLFFKRKRRLQQFAAQLPDALELMSRALRAGHSLASGFRLAAEEMSDPIGGEFGRVFEEQNLGMTIEDSLRNMCERVPNLDLKFFATAVILQRQTGGDLAEILDKIGRLVRERFQIWGQVQALTGEGRLSGIVLLALPPVLFAAVWRLNPDYLMMLFTDPLGKKMLVGGIVSQLVGAIVIRKIVNIKV